ncbi:zinc finger protein 708-like [Schistocerca gregaria]|uniref:zinc finger protein 708-like n=1 Tax=Schistocerca gregaria TaxID=7010 RepID=UPI00211E14BB|nr:zinc finger protein 708-like [Schistocerca gregaria]
MSENYHVLTVGNHEKYGCSDEDQSSILLDSLPEVSVPEHNVWSPYKETREASKKSSKDVCNTSMRNDADKISDYGTLSAAVNVSAQDDLLTAKMWSDSLKTHELVHTGKKPHKCEICGTSFARSGYLKTHLLNHTGKKPRKCVICDKSFAQSSNLKTHKLIHTGHKPHKCDICGRRFALSSYLKKQSQDSEVNSHWKKPHKCEICGKSFRRSDSLKTHELVHTGKKPHKYMEKSKPEFGTHTGDVTVDEECSVATQYDCSTREKALHVYSCNFCQEGFPSKYRLNKHVFMHIDGMQPPLYVCKWCGEIFDSKFSLRKHLRMSGNYHVLTAGNHEKYGYSDEDQSSILLDSLPEVSVPEHNVWSPYKETRKASKKSSKDVCNTSMRNDADKISDYGTLSAAVNVSAQDDLLTAKMWYLWQMVW